MSSEIIPFPSSAGSESADPHATRMDALFAWARDVLQAIGVVKAIADAKSLAELRAITLNLNRSEVISAILAVLHPAGGGRRHPHFVGLNEAGLKSLLKNQFADLKKDREKNLRHHRRGQKPDWTEELILDKEDKVTSCLANLILILRHAKKWKGVLAFDEFANQVLVRKPLPWIEQKPDPLWSDHYESLTRAWFQRNYRLKPSLGDIGRAVQASARANSFHPVRDYFDSLVWDRVSRLESWLQTYFHAADTPYMRAVGPRWLISGVARIYQPGCKADHCLVLEGPQGLYKSLSLQRLAIKSEWHSDRISAIGSKDALIEIAGVLIIELAELDAIKRAASSTAKSFLTSQYDRFRPPFGTHIIRVPRQSIFAATINPPSSGRYLKDSTGNRRFWPVACQGEIDIEGLSQVVDQLWAEAVHLYKAGHPWHLETPQLEALASAEQAQRSMQDAWRDPISVWVNKHPGDVSVDEVLTAVFDLAPDAQTLDAQTRAANNLKDLGFKRVRTRKGSKRKNLYRRTKKTP